jgi:hypothetical protein
MFFRVLDDGTSDGLRQFYGHRVADEAAYAADMNTFAPLNKAVGLGEALQQCSFAEGYRAILLGMSEAPIPEAEELRG